MCIEVFLTLLALINLRSISDSSDQSFVAITNSVVEQNIVC